MKSKGMPLIRALVRCFKSLSRATRAACRSNVFLSSGLGKGGSGLNRGELAGLGKGGSGLHRGKLSGLERDLAGQANFCSLSMTRLPASTEGMFS
jgi:hypothetical protein